MKNIHVLKTSKPSKLLKDLVDKTYQFKKEVSFGNRIELPLNIYITSYEEIKEGDWVITYNGLLAKVITEFEWHFKNSKKIIITTDQDLIKDGVQAIDDDFLEWFVKNPSCEWVDFWKYMLGEYSTMTKEESKQETLEEAVDRASLLEFPIKEWYRSDDYNREEITAARDGFKRGAKWQAERMYSEEEVLKAQQSILCNIKDALMNKNYIIEYLNNLKTNKI
jgi:hypothetical protein